MRCAMPLPDIIPKLAHIILSDIDMRSFQVGICCNRFSMMCTAEVSINIMNAFYALE